MDRTETGEIASLDETDSPDSGRIEDTSIGDPAVGPYEFNKDEQRARVNAQQHQKREKADAHLVIPCQAQSRPLLERMLDTGYHACEILAALAGIIVTLPVFLALVAWIRLDTPGPAIFVAHRAGQSKRVKGSELIGDDSVKAPQGGIDPDRYYWKTRTIPFLKFRTMYHDSMERFPEYYWWEYDIDAKQARTMFYKLEDDPRLTPVGKWLRKTSLDELPNLLNIISGHVRLVGPRPELWKMLPFYTEEEMVKFTIKPGLTCYSKIYGRGELSVDTQIKWDIEYIRERSIWLDIKILFRTVGLVLTQRGAF